MNFTQAIKVFELNILRQTGVNVTPQQLGLKSDPIADLQAQSQTTSFGSLLGRLTGSTTPMTIPTPPTPPADPADPAAQAKYQQEVLTYNQQYQLYNQRFMQMLMTQMQSMQHSMASMSRQQSSSSSSGSSDGSALGIGGILDV